MRLVRQQLRSDTGWVYRRAQATIFLSDGATLATLFNGNATPHLNPVTTNDEGYVEFYVADSVLSLTYQIQQGFTPSPIRPLPVGVVTTVSDAAQYSIAGTATETIFIGHAIGIDSNGDFYLVKSTNPAHSGKCVGVSESSSLAGQNIRVITAGPFDKAAYSFTPGEPVFVGPNGELTQVVPTSWFEQQVGVAITATKILIDIEPALDLA